GQKRSCHRFSHSRWNGLPGSDWAILDASAIASVCVRVALSGTNGCRNRIRRNRTRVKWRPGTVRIVGKVEIDGGGLWREVAEVRNVDITSRAVGPFALQVVHEERRHVLSLRGSL